MIFHPEIKIYKCVLFSIADVSRRGLRCELDSSLRYAWLMSAQKPLDVWKMVAGRRLVDGRLPLSALPRLAGLLFDTGGEVQFSLGFDRDALQVAYVELDIQTTLPLQCQRSLQRFGFEVQLRQRLGLIGKEADEAGLPPGYEPLLVPASGEIRAADLIEDELILAIPVVPVAPGSPPIAPEWGPPSACAEPERDNPFAVLSALKDKP